MSFIFLSRSTFPEISHDVNNREHNTISDFQRESTHHMTETSRGNSDTDLMGDSPTGAFDTIHGVVALQWTFS